MPANMTARTWTPDTWRDCPIRQVPAYPDAAKLDGDGGAARAAIRRWCSPARRGG